uniref:UDP-glucuronosyltransferase n=1 Tax=Helicoverpa armigera TaxID=29058 RepID=G9LPR2_HELAM|nr:UDP-glycosyltransferase UGT42B2 [Helicoverpa armigera]
MKPSALIVTLLSLLVLTDYACSLNILGIFPYHGKSHFIVFRVFLRELAKRGRNVTVISHFPEQDPPKNYHDISLAGSIKAIEGEAPFESSYFTLFLGSLYLATTGVDNCKVLLADDKVQRLIKENPKFDVIVVEQFNSDCALGIAYKFQAPVVGIMSHILMPYHYERLGVPYNPAYVPFHFLEGGTKPSLYHRVERTIFDFYFRMLNRYYTQRSNQNTLAQYFDDIPPLEELGREIKFLLLYHNFILTGSRLFPSNVIEVGGFHVVDAKPLTGDLKKFVEEAEHGVIYISFGSIVKASTMPAEKVQEVLNVMKRLPQRFVWKWEDKTLMVDKDKLYTNSWLPQVDILAHPKTLAFLSHAGNGGTTEAIHYGVPMVAMPVGGDQPANAAAIEESDLGVQLQIRDLNEENLLNAFRKVLDPKFRQRVKEVSKAWHDRPLPPLDTAVYWTEFAAKYPNFNFRTAAADVPFYQYINLDVAAVFITIISIIFIVLRSALKICCGRKESKGKNTKSNKVEKKKAKRA